VATTTNFGWTTPDNTGYVKDGALAIRTLGNSIDTSLVDLKGGTTGQVLKKTSDTDMDFEWGTVSSTPRIAQIVKAGTTSATTVSSSAYSDVSGLSVTITPTLSTSKILIITSFGISTSNGSSIYYYGLARLVRGSTELQSIVSGGYYPSGNLGQQVLYIPTAINYLDSPATTSATTYKIQGYNVTGSPTQTQVGASASGDAQIIAMEYLV
jgi:hypothetical protein